MVITKLALSARAYDRILKVGRAIADMAGRKRYVLNISVRQYSIGVWIGISLFEEVFSRRIGSVAAPFVLSSKFLTPITASFATWWYACRSSSWLPFVHSFRTQGQRAFLRDRELTFGKLDTVNRGGNTRVTTYLAHLLAEKDVGRDLAESYSHVWPTGVYVLTARPRTYWLHAGLRGRERPQVYPDMSLLDKPYENRIAEILTKLTKSVQFFVANPACQFVHIFQGSDEP